MKIRTPYHIIKRANVDILNRRLRDALDINAMAASLIEKIISGELQAEQIEICDNDNRDRLLGAISELHRKMTRVAAEDKERDWASKGLAQFVDLLRKDKDIKELADSLIAHIVKYVRANQGGIFILNDMENEDSFLELTGCYAYGRKKFLEKKVSISSGLLGQCYHEAQTMLLTEIPKDYIHITSGLGQATPRCLIILPVKLDGSVLGVIELASFVVFKPFEIQYLEKLCDLIASTIANKKINDRTSKLLNIAQQQAKEMIAQEEELRQNMEEMEATQEEMVRKQLEIENLLQQAKVQETNISQMALRNMEEKEKLQAEIDVLKFQLRRKERKIQSMTMNQENGSIDPCKTI